MKSNNSIEINNLNGNFKLIGKGSELLTTNIHIIGELIKGEYKLIEGINEIQNLIAEDDSVAYFKNEDIDMYALKAVYNKSLNIIELFEQVEVIRGGETILGDYAIVNTLDKSYKVNSKKSNKVKILINNSDE